MIPFSFFFLKLEQGDITRQHQPTHSAKSHRTPFSQDDEGKKEFYDSWFALFLDVIFAVKPQPYILLCPSELVRWMYMCACLWFIFLENFLQQKQKEEKYLRSRRCFRDKKWSLFKRWKSRPRIIVDGKAPNFKNCWNPSASARCHAQSINFSSDFYLANYECGFLFDFSSFDFPLYALLVEVEGICWSDAALLFFMLQIALAWTLRLRQGFESCQRLKCKFQLFQRNFLFNDILMMTLEASRDTPEALTRD